MAESLKNIVVVGQGAAGLAAALAAAQAGRGALRVTLVDKAAEGEAGGNTRWSPSYMRMAAVDTVEPSFVHDMLAATQYQGDETYFATLAHHAPATCKWIEAQGVEFIKPTYYLAKGPPRIQPLGGGPAVVKQLAAAAKAAGVVFHYNCAAQSIDIVDDRIVGLQVMHKNQRETLKADAIILCCGGFEGDGARMREYFGDGAETMRLISPGGKFNTGDGIKMAMALGADGSGDWNGMHAEPVDARSRNSAPVVLVYPYGIVVDKNGDRFFDEGAGLVHETWEWFARDMQFKVPGRMAFAILDSRLLTIEGYERAIRSEVPPARADTLDELAKIIGVDAAGLARTVAAYNAACTGDQAKFDATRCDGLKATASLAPPKSNWARGISQPPFLAYPLVGAVAYTFGGLATDERARVLRGERPAPGLYAAGEITGHFYATAPNAVSILRAFVFGRIAGLEAVAYLQAP
ncbi:MAG: succinate dehydrogenase/fumarate reductase, flavoprotein subunit [Hyphomicrobiales bacterium]|nr:succinate dehydrogenase/fumarate reductase, flavoprotein subunit [Hyphomicrobiales bacterium]